MNASYSILMGDCLQSLAGLESQSVNCCVTSPPYYGLRDYGVDGQIGLESTPEAYIESLVAVFREVRRVLREDGTLWLNLGDSYGKKKQLLGIPWRAALALQADGWCLRQDIIWHKPNPMPESVRDRCTKAHEYVFLLSKSPRYYYDHEASKEPSTGRAAGNARHAKGAKAYLSGDESHRTKSGLAGWDERQRSRRDSFKRDNSKRAQTIPGQRYGTHRVDREESQWDTEKRNRRSVWTVSARPYKGAHFATFPPDLVVPCVLAGCPAGGVVLDPFSGSGTTGGVAVAHGRNAVLCELNPEYSALTDARVASISSKMGAA